MKLQFVYYRRAGSLYVTVPCVIIGYNKMSLKRGIVEELNKIHKYRDLTTGDISLITLTQ